MLTKSFDGLENLIKTEALIEQHIHGGFGIDFSNCSVEDFLNFSKQILKYGVVAFLPTLATDTIENLRNQIAKIKEAQTIQSNTNEPMAKIIGCHLEACFLNPQKKGIHDESLFLEPAVENYQKIEDDIIKIVTLAPELDTNFELCNYLTQKGVRVSAGHCLGCDLSKVSQVTHLYNAMGNFSHRGNSTVVSALANDNIFVELIGDLKHVEKDVLKITFAAKDCSKIILISDALPIAHSTKDKMEFCGKTVFLKDGKAISSDGMMAGSTTFVSEIIKLLVSEQLLDFQSAVKMASTNICYFDVPKAQVYWDKNFSIKVMQFEDNYIFFD